MQKQFRDYFQSVLQAEIDAKARGKERFIRAQKDGLRFIDKASRTYGNRKSYHIR